LILNRKSKVLADEYQLLVDQRQSDIDRLTKSLEQRNLIVERVEKTTHDEVIPLRFSLFILLLSKYVGSYSARISCHRCSMQRRTT
jgi:hypothetical protein